MAISKKVAEGFAEIVTKARKVDAFVAEIATASEQQNAGIHEVNTAVAQLDKVTQANASMAEESAALAEEFSAQAVVTQESVRRLQHLVS